MKMGRNNAMKWQHKLITLPRLSGAQIDAVKEIIDKHMSCLAFDFPAHDDAQFMVQRDLDSLRSASELPNSSISGMPESPQADGGQSTPPELLPRTVLDLRVELIVANEDIDRLRMAAMAHSSDLYEAGRLCAQSDDEYPLAAVQRVVAELAASQVEVERLRAALDAATTGRASAAEGYRDVISAISKERDLCRSALALIAMPVRPDGTYNRSREACERIAREALNEARK